MPEMNEPNAENSLTTGNHRSETMVEHDLFMNNLMRRLQLTDENGKPQDPFIFVEKYVFIYLLIHNT